MCVNFVFLFIIEPGTTNPTSHLFTGKKEAITGLISRHCLISLRLSFYFMLQQFAYQKDGTISPVLSPFRGFVVYRETGSLFHTQRYIYRHELRLIAPGILRIACSHSIITGRIRRKSRFTLSSVH